MSRSIALIVLPFTLIALAAEDGAKPHAAKTELRVPLGHAPTLDGTLADGEWKDALVVVTSGEGEKATQLLAQEHGGNLYFALRTKQPGITTLGIAVGDKIRVLHASAALGSVEYAPVDKSWKRAKDFEYRCREDAEPKLREAERKEHLEKHGWSATTITMGAGQTELVLGPELIAKAEDGTRSVRCALTLTGATSFRAPKELADGVIHGKLGFGTAPETLNFDTSTWMKLTWKPAPPPPK